jgi:putative addiction module component (TIGR02574 family)
MTFNVDQLRQLPVSEKLRVVEELWDDIASSGEQFPLPAWHREEAVKRMTDLAADPSIAIGRLDIWSRVGRPPA